VNTDKVWVFFNVMQSTLIKMNQPIRFSSEFDQNDFINAKVDFIETQLSETDKTNRIRVYLNNSNLKFPIDCDCKVETTHSGYLGSEASSEHW
jgi:Cu(I)/Ag(I) efflux system membrane fusion protein